MSDKRRTLRRDRGFTLIEMLITIAISGIITGVIATAVYVSFSNNSATTQRFNGANDSLTLTNVFGADVSSTPPGGREVGAGLASECSGTDPGGSFNVLRLTWSEQAAGVITYYRTNYRLVNDSSKDGNLVRISCTSTAGAHAGYGTPSLRTVGSSLTTVPPAWSGGVPAVLSYTTLDGNDLALTLTVNTKPNPTTFVAAAQRSNPGVTLPPPPVGIPAPSIAWVTTAAEASYAAVGTTLHFSALVQNSGTTTLTNVGIVDPIAASAPACAANSSFLAPGETTICTFAHIVTQSDLDAGAVTSRTIASGAPPTGSVVTGVAVPVAVTALQSPAMTAVKGATTTGCSPLCYKAANDTIAYTLLVSNVGNVTLSNLSVSDPKSTGTITCPLTTLGPGATTVCTYRYIVVAADLVVNGSVNTAGTAKADPPSGPFSAAVSTSIRVPFQPIASIAATKSSTATSFVTVGQIVPYTIDVTNTGNVQLSSVSVTDLKADAVPTCPQTLAPAATGTCDAQHTVTAQDVANGSVVNQAIAFGTPASGGSPISAMTNTVTIPYNGAASMSLTKVVTTSPNTFKKVGDVLNYTLTVTNTGGQQLTGITVTDAKDSDGNLHCGATALNPLKTTTCTVSHVVVASELGSPIVNTASATANPGPLSATSNTVTVNFVPVPSLTVSLTASPSAFTSRGGVITYAMTIANTGNVQLTGVGISSQTLAAGSATCAANVLEAGASTSCTSTYTTTTDDASGSVTNVATASATYAGASYTATSNSVTVNSNVPCFVQAMSASPAIVGRDSKNHLASAVAITVSTGGASASCTNLYIQYTPSTGAVNDKMRGGPFTWTYTIDGANGPGNVSTWNSRGPQQIDVLNGRSGSLLPTLTGVPFTPFAVS